MRVEYGEQRRAEKKMIEDEQIAKFRKCRTRNDLTKWLREDIALALRSPKKEEVLAFLKRIQEEDKNDPAIYRIQLFTFSSDKYYGQTLLVVKDIVQSLVRTDIEVRNLRDIQAIEIAFESEEGLDEFSKLAPFP